MLRTLSIVSALLGLLAVGTLASAAYFGVPEINQNTFTPGAFLNFAGLIATAIALMSALLERRRTHTNAALYSALAVTFVYVALTITAMLLPPPPHVEPGTEHTTAGD